jgi:peptidoglycan/xylan/chitin deacetylase (PgdA/CDA1 family)
VTDWARRAAEGAADVLIRACGVLSVLRWLEDLGPRALRVLLYHRVVSPGHDPLDGDRNVISAEPEAFAGHVRLIARHYDPIGAGDLAAHLENGRPLPRRAVLVTFDDGYHDVVTHAWPILKQHRVPAVVFVPTAFPGSARVFWWDLVWQWFRHTAQTQVAVPDLGAVDLSTPPARLAATRRVVRWLRPMRPDAVAARMEALAVALGTSQATGPPSVAAWDALRQAAGEGLSIGSHGVTHASLPSLADDELAREIDDADGALRREIGESPRVFAYPFGHHDARAAAALKARGYLGAFCATPGRNTLPLGDPFALARQSVNVAHSFSRVALGVSGFYRPAGGASPPGRPHAAG